MHSDPPDSKLECVQESDAAQKTKTEVESNEEEPPDKREGLETSTAMAASNMDAGALEAQSPRSRVGKGLETIGDMTVDTLQRITTVVGGVVKSPVVRLFSKFPPQIFCV